MKSLVAVVLALAALSCRPHWDKKFKADLRDQVELKLTMAGAEDLAAPLAACIVDEAEKRVPKQEDMQAIIDGAKTEGNLGPAVLQHCACDVVKDPRALALPGYCEAKP